MIFAAAKIISTSGWFLSPFDVTLVPLIASLLSSMTRHSRIILDTVSVISSFSERSLYVFK